jgi:hypothetical protein
VGFLRLSLVTVSIRLKLPFDMSNWTFPPVCTRISKRIANPWDFSAFAPMHCATLQICDRNVPKHKAPSPVPGLAPAFVQSVPERMCTSGLLVMPISFSGGKEYPQHHGEYGTRQCRIYFARKGKRSSGTDQSNQYHG